ncbi:hypothetical protein DEA8626_00833 [Defluviimonas aquaemixtae]|uniref:Lysozyme inhibitor LprI-like N-terminal domain-containing protein n=1 Tax=Albidovulum aquaemixtae TaxID=1542388 RepID=A0A2R8B3Z7_9RHOB|nr:lysozyme inhibitor LprI family protein [Defluviimonas aquaemixtae]SPH17315.1 hypothetical protein DEA8626_00833 [Defluviimonas aquaemixtae]
MTRILSLGVFAMGLVLFLTATGVAQTPVLDRAQVEGCFAATPVGSVDPDCLGAAATACQSATPDGETTLGITACIQAETQVWDEILNREYRETRGHISSQPGLADQLLAAQRAWIAFRDAECGLAYSLWLDGSMRTIAAANCLLDLTARRSFELRDMGGY